jgi:mannose-1-phosphate guanylyltransferase
MKTIVFAGGAGRRLWPISRVMSPKQFEPILNGKSTLQLAVDNLLSSYSAEDVYISTNAAYVNMIAEHLPYLPEGHVIGEPARRDLAPAVALAMLHLLHDEQAAAESPVAIIWGDSIVSRVDNFHHLLDSAELMLQSDVAKLFFIGETPRFANNNLGWIGLGEELENEAGTAAYGFRSLAYRPDISTCIKMFESGGYVWNTGYFVTTPGYVLELYRRHKPQMWEQLLQIKQAIGRPDYQDVLKDIYPRLESISFDDAILTNMPAEDAAVLHGSLGWSDPGTLYALKEALQPLEDENLLKGLLIDDASRDSLIYNYEEDKLVVAIGLDGMVVVNTDDALLVVHKDNIPLVKKIVNDFEGTDLEKYS